MAQMTFPLSLRHVLAFAKKLLLCYNIVNWYLDTRREKELAGKNTVKIVLALHMNITVIWSHIAHLQYEDLYEIGFHLSTLKNILPKVPFDNRDKVVVPSNSFKNIQPNLQKDNLKTDNMEIEKEFPEQYPDLQISDHL
jgi:hypothetical protein